MNTAMSLQRRAIRELEVDAPNIMLLGLLIGKQEPRQLKRDESRIDNGEDRSVWNFTIRDSPRDYINVTFWGSSENLNGLNTVAVIGSILEITNPKVTFRSADDVGERFRPIVTSAFQLTVNEGIGTVNKVRDYRVDSLSRLVHLPTKPICNYTTLAYVFSNIHALNGTLVDLLVAVRQVGEMRVVNTKNGIKEVRNIEIFDNTNPGMSLTFWDKEYIARSSLWVPRETILFIADAKVTFDTWSNGPKGSTSMKSIITENPEGKEAQSLREYAKTAVLHNSTVMSHLVAHMPEVASIKQVMNIREILKKINQVAALNSTIIEENQFAIVVYATVTEFDIDGLRRVFSTRCSLCKSMIKNESNCCQNPACLSNTSNQTIELEKWFDIFMQISDKTGSLRFCRLNGKHADQVLGCTPSIFLAMSDVEKADIKWKYLLELCELRLVILLKNKRPYITVLTCERASVTKLLTVS